MAKVQHWSTLTVDVNVDRERQGQQVEKSRLPFSTGRRRRSTSTAEFFLVNGRQLFSSHPIFRKKGCKSMANLGLSFKNVIQFYHQKCD